MEKLGAAVRFGGESPGRTVRARTVEAGSQHPQPPGTFVVYSPESRRPLTGGGGLSAGAGQHPGKVPGRKCAFCVAGYPVPQPGTSASCPGPGNPAVHSSECSSLSGSTCLHSEDLNVDQHRGILKVSPYLMRSPSSEKKAQHWDEMNIRATYHPADKDYGFMKVDEPSTPYRREDSDENLAAGSSPKVTADMLEQRFATMDNLLPKVLQYGDNRSPGPAADVSKPYSKDFAQQRKMHYSEGKALKPQKNLPLEDNMAGQGPSANVSSSGHQVTLSPEPLPLQRRGAAEQASIGVKGYSTCGNRSVPASGPVTVEQGMGPRRKEYFTQRRYLRSDFHPELDMEDERQDSSTGMTWRRESPLSTEVRLLDSTSSSLSERQPTEDSLTMMVISSQPGITTSSQERRSQVLDWVQWPGAQELSPQSPGSSKKERGSHLDPSSHRRHKYETVQVPWTQKEEI